MTPSEFHLYTYNKKINAPEGAVIQDANKIIREDKIFLDDRDTVCAFSDMFRYVLLYKKGGWWVDMDVICLRPFDFKTDYIFASEHDSVFCGIITAGVIKAPKHSNLMKFCKQAVERIYSDNFPNIKWGTMSSMVLKTYIVNHPEYKIYIQPPHIFCPLPYFYYSQYFIDMLIDFTDQTYSVHLWNEMLRLNRINPESEFHPNSYYQRLKKLFA